MQKFFWENCFLDNILIPISVFHHPHPPQKKSERKEEKKKVKEITINLGHWFAVKPRYKF